MNQEKYEKRVAFCKAAAERGMTAQEYLACKQKNVKQAFLGIDVAGLIGSAAEFARGSTGLALAGSTIGGAGLGLLGAYGLNAIRNQYPTKFAPTSNETSSIREEKIRQLIARYRRATEDVRRQTELFADADSPNNSAMDRYGTDDDFGGFGG